MVLLLQVPRLLRMHCTHGQNVHISAQPERVLQTCLEGVYVFKFLGPHGHQLEGVIDAFLGSSLQAFLLMTTPYIPPWLQFLADSPLLAYIISSSSATYQQDTLHCIWRTDNPSYIR